MHWLKTSMIYGCIHVNWLVMAEGSWRCLCSLFLMVLSLFLGLVNWQRPPIMVEDAQIYK